MKKKRSERLKQYLQNILQIHSQDDTKEAWQQQSDRVLESMSDVQGEPFDQEEEKHRKAKEGLDTLMEGQEAAPERIESLEAIIAEKYRPAIPIQDDSYSNTQLVFPWTKLSHIQYRNTIMHAIKAVGCLELPYSHRYPYAGTAFIVGEGLLLTNRHVAETFSEGVGNRHRIRFYTQMEPRIDFYREMHRERAEELSILGVRMIHPHWDAALLEVEGLDPHKRRSLVLESREMAPESIAQREVIVIGYPGADTRDPESLPLQQKIFQGFYEVKRMQPGTLMGYRDVLSYGKHVRALTHDCSTLGGNSGSVVLDLQSGRVVGLHFAGRYLDANFAVPAWALAQDSQLIDLGVSFHKPNTAKPHKPSEPLWITLKKWEHQQDADKAPTTTDIAPKQDAQIDTQHASPTHTADLSLRAAVGGDWWEYLEDWQLERAYRRNPSSVEKWLQQDSSSHAEEILEQLRASGDMGQECFLTPMPAPDPALPEIILLHGIMGAHLHNTQRSNARMWFNPLALVFERLAEALRLREDGISAHANDTYLEPAGPLCLKYGRAERFFRQQRYIVHRFSYDWRKSVHIAAERLFHFIERLHQDNPQRSRRFVLVAHSMGGLVASLYAQRSPHWSSRIERAFFAGVPLAGSYTPIDAILGTYPFFRLLARISMHNNLLDLRTTAATLPGLLDMLPHPKRFPSNPGSLYEEKLWRNADAPYPMQRWLSQSLYLKEELLESPLLAKTIGFACSKFGTIENAERVNGLLRVGPRNAPGDGVVPLRSAAVPELQAAYLVEGYRHDDLLRHPKVLQAIDLQIRDGDFCSLDLTPVVLDNQRRFADLCTQTETLQEEGLTPSHQALLQRLRRAQYTPEDLDWILDPLRALPPG
ncbi:MAG: trypsin-like peptidase domain-containing protein [Myxococcota bacterium]